MKGEGDNDSNTLLRVKQIAMNDAELRVALAHETTSRQQLEASVAQLATRVDVLRAALAAHRRAAAADRARLNALQRPSSASATSSATATTTTQSQSATPSAVPSLARDASVRRDPARADARSARRATHYHAAFSRADAEAHLRAQPPNTFVTRPSRLGASALALSYVAASGQIKHIVVQSARGRYWLDGTAERFDSLVELLVAFAFIDDPLAEARRAAASAAAAAAAADAHTGAAPTRPSSDDSHASVPSP